MDDTLGLPEQKLLRVLRMLEYVASASEPVTIGQMAMRLDIPKASAARLADVLVTNRFLSRMPDDRGLIPGPRSTQLSTSALSNGAFRRLARAVLRGLVDRLGETCNLSAFDGDRVLYLDRVETNEPLRMHLELGSRHPLHCTAGGKLFLSQLPRLEREELLDRIVLTRMTPRTIVTRATLATELDSLAKQGIGTDEEEFVTGMVGVAVPIALPGQRVSVALVCHAAAARSTLTQLRTQLPMLQDAARRLHPLFYVNEAAPASHPHG